MNNLRLLSRFRFSAEMRPYVLRLRLTGRDFHFGTNPADAAAFNIHINLMRKILVSRRIATVAADRAILKTLEAAVDHQLSQFRFDQLRTMEQQSRDALDRLISELRGFCSALALLPPTSKGKLNQHVCPVISGQPFDAEVFIEVIETIIDALREVSPKKLADDARSLIDPPLTLTFKAAKFFLPQPQRPHVVDRWESLPAATRVEVERLMRESRPATSMVGWLTSIVDLLVQHRPAPKLGAPSSQLRLFVWRVSPIWRRMGLKPGLEFVGAVPKWEVNPDVKIRRVESGFQIYCRASLAAFGDNSKISARQVATAKKMSRSITY